MSLLFDSPKEYKYVSPSSGDIAYDPELTRHHSLSFISNDDSQDHGHLSAILSDQDILAKDLKIFDLPVLRSISSYHPKEYTTQDKILQVQTGDYVLNALKGNKNYNGDLQLVSEEGLRQSMLVNYRKNPDGTLEMINQLQLKKQKQVLGFLVKQFGSALFTGKSIMSVSLPVSIFESQSHLEREARSLSYAPHFLEKGGDTQSTLEQFKLAIAHFISSLHMGTNPQKPFNPVLGETFQGKIGDCPIYVEQISHHPPKSALQLLGKNFTVEGLTEFTADISMNSVKSWKVGHLKVTYKNTNTIVRAQYPPGLMSGTAIGKRTFQFADKFYIFDVENRYYTEICFDNNESSLFKKKSKSGKDQFTGTIYMIKDTFAEKLKQAVKQRQDISEIKFREKDHVAAKLDNIEGSWLESLKIGGQTYWSFGAILPYKLQYVENPLPSDSNYRLDVLYMRADDEVKSQRYKELLEESQRGDKKLREHAKKKALK